MCLQYVCFVLNHSYNTNINGIPLTHLTGSTIDISVLLRFHFWQKVYYKAIEPSFPSDSVEEMGYVVGISEHCGHALTWKILTCDAKRVIDRSIVRPSDPSNANIRADSLGGEMVHIIKSRNDSDNISDNSNQISTTTANAEEENTLSMDLVTPDDIVGRSFL